MALKDLLLGISLQSSSQDCAIPSQGTKTCLLHSAAPSATKKRGLTPTLSPSTPIPPSISICFSLVCVCISFHKKPYMFWEHKSTDYFVLFLHLFLSQRSFNINVTIDNMFFHIAYYQTFRFLLLMFYQILAILKYLKSVFS